MIAEKHFLFFSFYFISFYALVFSVHLIVQLSLARMLHLLSCAVQLLVLGSDLIAARLVVLAQAGIVGLQAPDFRLQAGHLSRELGVLQRPLVIGWNTANIPNMYLPIGVDKDTLRRLQQCIAALAVHPRAERG